MTALDRFVRKAVRDYAARWRTLKAWRNACTGVPLVIVAPQPSRLGICRSSHFIEINVRPGQALADALGTVLHEFAHVVAAGDGHGCRWREVYADACQEVTGRVVPVDPSQRVMDGQVTGAISGWLRDGSPEIAPRPVLKQDTDGHGCRGSDVEGSGKVR